MPSLRQRVSTYFRQLSFIAEPRAERNREFNDGSFITKYLEGNLEVPQSPDIKSGKEPKELPDLLLGSYDIGTDTINASFTAPYKGCCGIKRIKLHLSAGPEIDFIDTIESQEDLRQIAASKSFIKQYQRSNSAKSDKNANNNAAGFKKASSRKNSIANSQPDVNLVTDTLNKNLEINKAPIEGQSETTSPEEEDVPDICSPIPGIYNWKQHSDDAFGIAVSLYETNLLTQEHTGSPIADCFAIVSRSNAAVLALADGVNWGENAKIAATAAIHGCVEYIDTAIFGQGPSGTATSTREVFVSLLRSFWEAHACILEVNGALTTLTCAVVLPLDEEGKFCVCAINVGDSFGFVYSKKHGVREFTQGSHDTKTMRNMRDALGALGPVDGNKPELGNLTISMTICEQGDIVFLASDGITDNFDPVVGKFAEPLTDANQIAPQPNNPSSIEPKLAPKRQNKSASQVYTTRRFQETGTQRPSSSQPVSAAAPTRPPRTKKSTNITNENSNTTTVVQQSHSRPKYLRSHTLIEPRLRTPKSPPPISTIPRSAITGLPLVTAEQRHALTILRLNDLFSFGINGTSHPCTSAKKLCQVLIDFVRTLTSAKRKLLEQHENYYKLVANEQGYRREIEMSRGQQRAARKRVVDGSIFSTLPGKLDHASIVAWMVPLPSSSNNPQKLSIPLNYTETNF